MCVERDKCDLYVSQSEPASGATYPRPDAGDVWIELKAQSSRDQKRGVASSWNVSGDYSRLVRRLKEQGDEASSGISMLLLVQSPNSPSIEDLLTRMRTVMTRRPEPQVRPVLAGGSTAPLAVLSAWPVAQRDVDEFDLDAARGH